jgi:hypothetical protein
VVEDGAILFGVSLIYVAMLATIIVLGRIFAHEQDTGASGSTPSHRA